MKITVHACDHRESPVQPSALLMMRSMTLIVWAQHFSPCTDTTELTLAPCALLFVHWGIAHDFLHFNRAEFMHFFSTCMLIYCLRRHILSCHNIPANKPAETQAEKQRVISLSDVSYDCFLFLVIAFVCRQTLFSANNELRSVGAVVKNQTACSHQESLKCKENVSCIKECCRYQGMCVHVRVCVPVVSCQGCDCFIFQLGSI